MKSTGRFNSELRQLRERSYDQCQTCSKKLPKDIAAYAGYGADGSPLYVGECCKHLIGELASHIYWWWEADKRCAPETRLWRYMDFAKFVAMLDQSSINFARADILGDPFEGASGIVERQSEWDAFYMDFFRNAVRTVPGQAQPFPEDHIEREAKRLLGDFSRLADSDRQRTYVSCWHANLGESEALWRLYCPLPSMGIAVQTSAGLLSEALRDQQRVKIGHVQYVDFRKNFAGFHDRIFWKRKSLSHEAEVRAVIQLSNSSEDTSLAVTADIQKLLISVVPSPFAPSWFPALLQSVMSRFDINTPIVPSELLAQPFF